VTVELERKRLMRLMHKTADGDREAFKDLYDRTSGHVFGLLHHMLESSAQAEEVLQDVYLAVWTRAVDFHVNRGTVMTWIITIARRKAIDIIRRQGREITTDEMPEPVSQESDSPLQVAMAGSDAHSLHLCMDELSVDQRQSLSMAFFKGATHYEVSDALSKPVGTVKSWIRRGLDALKRCLER